MARRLDLPRCNSNPDDLRKLQKLLLSVKPHIKSFAYESKELINSGEVDIAQIWNGFSLRARRERPEMHYAYPREGFTGWMDNLVVLKDAENLENAKLFLNFMMDPENAAMQSNFTAYANGVKGSEAYISSEILESPEYQPPEWAPEPEFVPPCEPKVVTMYDRIWTNFLK
ncbi:MAG: extracellular solute-binding protein [Proteobacteria bacterium]|nr:MAG: extracellular solute-binding protein [Pseudomonadota bacterium]